MQETSAPQTETPAPQAEEDAQVAPSDSAVGNLPVEEDAQDTYSLNEDPNSDFSLAVNRVVEKIQKVKSGENPQSYPNETIVMGTTPDVFKNLGVEEKMLRFLSIQLKKLCVSILICLKVDLEAFIIYRLNLLDKFHIN